MVERIPKVKCSVSDDRAFTGTEIANEEQAGAVQQIVDVLVDRCRFSVDEFNVSEVTAEVSIDFHENSDIRRCAAVSLELLFEVSSATEDLEWRTFRVLTKDLAVESPEGTSRNIAYLELHKENTEKKITLAGIYSASGSGLSFDDMLWGQAVLLVEPPRGEYATILNKYLKAVAASSTSPEISVKVFPPRGVCYFTPVVEGKSTTEKSAMTFAPQQQK